MHFQLKECQKSMGTDQTEQMESRNKFVRRILEISAMVAKQNEEIRKVIQIECHFHPNPIQDGQLRAADSP